MNEVIEHFPVGSRIAFDAQKGRLWAVCPRCTRWNLAPIEERWEAVEEAERRFRDSRMRVQSENIGMAKMPDGTRLIRIGSALPGELAAWRYGTQIMKRRTNLYLGIGAGVITGGALLAGLPLLAAGGIPAFSINPTIQIVTHLTRLQRERRIVLRLDAHDSPTGEPLALRRRHLRSAKLTTVEGELGISLREPPRTEASWYRFRSEKMNIDAPRMWLRGNQAQLVAARAMVDYNARGASKTDVAHALDRLINAGSARNFIDQIAISEPTIIPESPYSRRRRSPNTSITPRRIFGTFRGERLEVEKSGINLLTQLRPLARTDALALEMALHDESERRAMEGDLDMLEDAWREAENIARIADALPDEPPE